MQNIKKDLQQVEEETKSTTKIRESCMLVNMLFEKQFNWEHRRRLSGSLGAHTMDLTGDAREQYFKICFKIKFRSKEAA